MNTPPAWHEWLTIALLLLTGVLCLRLGGGASRRSARSRNIVAAGGVALAVGGAAAHYPPLREIAGAWLCLPGGEGALACLGGLILLGIADAERKQNTSHLLGATATVLVFVLLLTLGGASLGWHYFGQRLRANYPDARGALQQTSGITCAPAAAAMLLHQAGVRVSEGALAELANTNPLQGTTPNALARAVDRVARQHGLHACVRRLSYAEAVRLQQPFVAFVRRPGVGGHALCVLKVEGTAVWVIDPLSGMPETVSRAEFAAEWDSTSVWIQEPGDREVR